MKCVQPHLYEVELLSSQLNTHIVKDDKCVLGHIEYANNPPYPKPNYKKVPQ